MNENTIVAITKLNEIVTDIDKDDTCFLDIKDTVEEVIALLEAKDTNVFTKWVSVKDRLPEVGGSYIVAGKQRYKGEPWEYFTDVAASHGSYIDDFWDTFNDWNEGQETHVTHWMPLPEPPKEAEA